MFRKHLPYDEETYALLISAYTRAGAKEKAMSTFADMQSKVYSPIFTAEIHLLLLTVVIPLCRARCGSPRRPSARCL
jgi:pentatricopeptide repeat protein